MTEGEHAVTDQDRDLMEGIQTDILDPSIPLSSVLRKAKVLAYRLNNGEFKDWVSQELDGYTGDIDLLPDYRKSSTHSLGDFVGPFWSTMRNTPIPTLGLSDELDEFAGSLSLFEGIRALESLLENEEVRFRIDWPPNYVAIVGRRIYDRWTCINAWKVVPRSKIEQILDTVKNRLLTFILELGQIQRSVGEASESGQLAVADEQIQRLFQVHIWGGYNVVGPENVVTQGEDMTVFDQRFQRVDYQFNAAGNINLEAVENKADVALELKKLQFELVQAISAGLFDEDTATDAEYHLKKAAQQASKPEPEKKTLLEHLNEAKALIEGVAAAAGLVAASVKAAELVQQLF